MRDTPYNFYNALPPLSGASRWFWQVTYNPGTAEEERSRVRAFDLTTDAVTWDRTLIRRAGECLRGHPRVIFTPENRAALLALRQEDTECRTIADQAIRLADETLSAPWFFGFPLTDTSAELGEFPIAEFSQYLQNVAFAWMLTGDDRYLAVKEPLLRLARYAPGGYASPEGIGHGHKFGTKITEHLAISFDWLYDQLSPEERETIVGSLDWRIRHITEAFTWVHGDEVQTKSIAVSPTSHAWENFTWTLTGALAVSEHSEAARRFVELGLHFLTGVGNGFGADEGWSEGVSYSHWKFSSLVATSLYAAMTLPDLGLERNPLYRRLGEFFLYLAPVGVMRPAWGDVAYQYRYHEQGQHAHRRKLAYLTGEGAILQAWREWRAALESGEVTPLDLGTPDINEITGYPRPWIEYALKHYFPEPETGDGPTGARVFPLAGWAMDYSEPPGTMDAFRKGVGFVFTCRPRGGYSHSHLSNGGFELFAYGTTLATGGGSKSNFDAVAHSSQSHNVVLIDGEGQVPVEGKGTFSNAGRIVAWREGTGSTYACADVRPAYGRHPDLAYFLRHFLFMRDRYFVIFDDVGLAPDAPPARFSWLYHIEPDVSVDIQTDGFDYAIGDVCAMVRHAGETGPLTVENMQGEDWYRNPVTGEDLFPEVEARVTGHPGLRKIWPGCPRVHNNLWLTTEPRREVRFLAAVVPYLQGETRPRVTRPASGAVPVDLGGDRARIAFGRSYDGADITVDHETMRRGT